MRILLVEPDYYTRFPPIGLLKLASHHRNKGDSVELVRGKKQVKMVPNRIYVTSLFTYSWKPVHDAVKYYKFIYPNVELWLGGIYASLMPEHAMLSGADRVYRGLFTEAEDVMPAYDLVPNWNGSIIFSSRGCLRKCGFCAVPKLEHNPNGIRYSIKDLVFQAHDRLIFWDNNILANDNWEAIFNEVIELNLKVDFNQGLDARLITDESAELLSQLKLNFIRIAYDTNLVGPSVKRSIDLLHEHGVRKKKIIVYTLFNFDDAPDDFFGRVKNILNWGAACYPMRFEPLDSLEKNNYIGKLWTKKQVDMVQSARRVLGFGGAFPPYEGLVIKFNRSRCFEEAFTLHPLSIRKPAINNVIKKKVRWIKEKDWRKVTALPRTTSI
jgi:hypothetical protein